MTEKERSLRALRKIRDYVESGNEEKALRLLGKEITRILREHKETSSPTVDTEERFTRVE